MTLEDSHYRALIEQAPSLIWRMGLDGQHDYFNATWLAFTGRQLEQERGDGWASCVHPADVGACLALQRDHFARRERYELPYRLRRHDGVYRRMVDRAVPYTDSGGAFAGFLGNCVDIDDRLAREESFGVNDFFEMSLDKLCVAGFDGYFKRLNPSWTQTLGWTTEELMGQPSETFLHPDDRALTLAARARVHRGHHLGPFVNRYRCRDGSYRWFEWRSVAHADRGLVYAAARDITEAKQAAERLSEAKLAQEKLERQLIFADRMASVGTLAAGVAHEINNPLSYVTANLNLMLETLGPLHAELPSRQLAELTELTQEAHEGAERIRKIVRGLQTFSRAEEGRRVVLDVRPLLDLSIDMTLNEIRHRARLAKEFGPVPPVEADDARLGQVFLNLLINAAQALTAGDSTANEIRVVTATDEVGRAVVEVHDTGVGIPAHLLGRVFDPFFTTKAVGVGTGLGLAICHNIVTSMGGELTVASTEGRGTTFRLVLPPASSPELEASVPVTSAQGAAVRGRVLVVDDEPRVGTILGRLLREHDVTLATTAAQALALIEAGQRFDVILSDLMMPEMSGMDFYDELERRAPELARRMVFVSGGAFTPSANAFLDRVPNERLAKPFEPATVRGLVRRFVQSRETDAAQPL